ncbi:MAG: glycosyltransferase family 2 protein [Calditrichaeota bacterium]|nr:MAG: glycosyltransferase family 2 protein [Calditrichota bacterium]
MEATADFAIVIPAYNAAASLPGLLQELLTFYPGAKVVVVNDGSTDSTQTVLKNFATVFAIHHDDNRGKGAALQSGMQFVKKHLRASAVVFMDADGQHLPEDIAGILQPLNRGEADLIIGKREFKPGKMPIPRIFSNKLTSYLLSLKLNRKISDSQSGFRVVAMELLKSLNGFKTSGYEFETEFLIRLVKAGARIQEVPIATIYKNETSHIKPLRDITRFLKVYFTT